MNSLKVEVCVGVSYGESLFRDAAHHVGVPTSGPDATALVPKSEFPLPRASPLGSLAREVLDLTKQGPCHGSYGFNSSAN